MCVEVIVNETVCENIGQLRAAIGREPVMETYPLCGPADDRDCLCHVDHDATAASVGMVVNMRDVIFWRYVPKKGRQR